MDFKDIVFKIREIYKSDDFIPLHPPVFMGNEKKYLNECIDSTFVSSVGKFVDKFEYMLQDFTKANCAIAVSNGTSALHAALTVLGVKRGDEVLTQALTFVATCNAISMLGADPVFIDVDKDTMGLSPMSLKAFLEENCERRNGTTYNKITGKKVSACVPMHTFGNPLRIREVVEICSDWNIKVVEDAAESLGSYVGDTHTGLFGDLGVLSFNGNKTITTGGGGAIITNNDSLGKLVKHITTTAKVPHKWEFVHDMVAFNYRMPNINAALGCAQLEEINTILSSKLKVAEIYKDYFAKTSLKYFEAIKGTRPNNWLHAIITHDKSERDQLLKYTNENGVMTRPIWTLMNKLEMYKDCYKGDLANSEWLEERVVNIPSGYIVND